MKRLIFVMFLALLLCACADTEPVTPAASEHISSENTTSATQEERPTYVHGSVMGLSVDLPINSAYEGPREDDSAMAMLLYPPFEKDLTPTTVWTDGSQEYLYIIPKYVGTRVDIYEVLHWEEYGDVLYADEPTYCVEVTDGCVIRAALQRPEDTPKWYIEVVATENDYGGTNLLYSSELVEYIHGESYAYYTSFDEEPTPMKPVIYLYPEKETEVTVKLDYNGKLTCTYPEYRDGWSVTAQPDGTLTDASGQTYNYLYWEGQGPAEYDFSKGFCVKGEDTAAFLESALAQLGLTRKEANEFIVFWLPMMQNNPYNIITFQTDRYTETAPLTITPAPNTLLRVYMAWYGSEEAIEIPTQELTAPERSGFTVVEWGGTQIK